MDSDSSRAEKRDTASPARTIIPAPDGRGYLVKGIPPTGRIWWPPSLQNKKSKTWDVDAVERETRYECAFCQHKIHPEKLNWMLARYTLRSHNPSAPEDIESAHIWAAYSPMDLGWGGLAKKYLLSIGNIAKMHDCYNSDWGRPFERTPTRITRKIIELIQAKSPKYERANPLDPADSLSLPVRPCFLTMQVDVQQTEYWWTVWAHALDGAMWLLAWGSCVSQQELDEIANRQWRFEVKSKNEEVRNPEQTGEAASSTSSFILHPSSFETHRVSFGLIDSGYKAKRQAGVYRFVHERGGRWIATKGGKLAAGKEKPIYETTIAFNYDGKEVDIPYIHYNDDQMQEHLYRFVIKERQHVRYLPTNLDEPFLEQVTSTHLVQIKLADGRSAHEWRYAIDPHLGDCWKLAEIFHFTFSADVLRRMREKQDSAREKSG